MAVRRRAVQDPRPMLLLDDLMEPQTIPKGKGSGPDAIIWDAGGVIYGFDMEKSYRIFAKDCRRSIGDVAQIIDGGTSTSREYNAGTLTDYNTGKIDSHEFYRRVKSALGLKMPFWDFAGVWGDIFTANQEIVDFILRVKEAGYTQGVLSSTNPLHWEGMIYLFDVENLLGKKSVVKTYDKDAGEKKPHLKLFAVALDRLGIVREPSRAVYVDDIKKYTDTALDYGFGGAVHVDLTQPDPHQKAIQELERLGFRV